MRPGLPFVFADPPAKEQGARSLVQRRMGGDAVRDAAAAEECSADAPSKLPLRTWPAILLSAAQLTLKHRAPATAAAATFYVFLAFIPAVAASGALFGWVEGPDALAHRLPDFRDLVPAGVLSIVGLQAVRFAHGEPAQLMLTALGFSLFSLVSATSAVRVLMEGLNTAYRAPEGRHWLRRRLLAAGFAAAIAVGLTADLALIVRSGDYLSRESQVIWPTVRLVLRWTSLFALSVVALAVLYRYGPDRRRARWRWVTPGSVVTAAVLFTTSAGTSIYLAHFANYERTYGGLGSVLGLLIWLWSAMVVVLAGAELNGAMEAATTAVTDVSGRPDAPAAPVPDAGPLESRAALG